MAVSTIVYRSKIDANWSNVFPALAINFNSLLNA